jgi:hypothetical protein
VILGIPCIHAWGGCQQGSYLAKRGKYMSANPIVSHVKENKRIYGDYRNLITLSLWGIALASHAILLPKLISEFRKDSHKGK